MKHPFQPTRLRSKKMRCFCAFFFHLKTDHPFHQHKKHLPTLRNGLTNTQNTSPLKPYKNNADRGGKRSSAPRSTSCIWSLFVFVSACARTEQMLLTVLTKLLLYRLLSKSQNGIEYTPQSQ